jgi:hypothetical protein
MAKELKITDSQDLDHNLKNVNVDGKSSALDLSKNKVKTKDLEVDGTLTVNGPINGALRSESDLNLESNGTINLTTSTADLSNDITLNTGGRDLFINNGDEQIIAFSNGGCQRWLFMLTMATLLIIFKFHLLATMERQQFPQQTQQQQLLI